MLKQEGTYLIGAGGHAKVILALLESLGKTCLGIYDDDSSLWGTRLLQGEVIGPVSDLFDCKNNRAVIAIGDNYTRQEISKRFRNIKWETLIHPFSMVHKSVKIGCGSVVFAGSVIQPDVTIGRHSIINTSVSIDHDCKIGNFCHLSPGTHFAGGIKIGDNVFCGVGVNIIPYLNICSHVTLGTGATVVDNINKNGCYIGIPSKLIVK